MQSKVNYGILPKRSMSGMWSRKWTIALIKYRELFFVINQIKYHLIKRNVVSEVVVNDRETSWNFTEETLIFLFIDELSGNCVLINEKIERILTSAKMAKAPTIRLNNGFEQPAIALGTYTVSFNRRVLYFGNFCLLWISDFQ